MAEEEEDAEEVKVDAEIDTFIEDVKKTLELYINRMKSDSMRGRSITNDTAVQSLFLQLQHLQPKLMSYIKYKEDDSLCIKKQEEIAKLTEFLKKQ